MRRVSRRLAAVAVIAGCVIAHLAAPHANASRADKPVTLNKAGLLLDALSSQDQVIAPGSGQWFLWVKATASAGQTIDLKKISLVSGASSSTAFGVDAANHGDPVRFSMMASARLRAGDVTAPIEEAWSRGGVAFAFSPGNAATLTIVQPPASFALLFQVSRAFQSGRIFGLGPAELTVPPVPRR